ncbi:hypothetical protein DV515_00012269, partial [Chloebia gouldiae]
MDPRDRAAAASPHGTATASRDRERAARAQRGCEAIGCRRPPAPIATRGSAGLTAGTLGPAWANRVGEGGRRPRRAAVRGEPRWRQWGGPADTALPVLRPRALSAAAPSSARDRGPLSPHGDGAGTRERPASCGAPASPSPTLKHGRVPESKPATLPENLCLPQLVCKQHQTND